MTLSRFKKLKKGQKVKLNKSALLFYKNHSFEINCIGGVLKAESYALQYMASKMIGLGFKHEITYIGPNNTADKKNTAYFRVYLGNGLGYEAYYDRKSLV